MSHNEVAGSRSRVVTSADGVRIATHEHGDPSQPTLIAVHGYPDDHTVWDDVVAELADLHHLVTYDVRGAGRSDAPASRAAYRLDRLEADLCAVVDAVAPTGRVHLLAHDWGSIQTWHAVTGDALRGRIASFTSISGPCLDHVGHWFRSRLGRPSARGLRELLSQAVRSGYIAFFQVPGLAELAWRANLVPRALRVLERGGVGSPSVSDGIQGLELYRANVARRLRRPSERRAEIPVQVVAPTGDRYVSAPLQTGIGRWVPDLRVQHVPGGHWLPRTRPDLVARCAAELVDRAEHTTENRRNAHADPR
ncbi:alpha/beta fold hydrolase [Saccharopolyspora rhizosphaerae]|uniref:Alpha/beta fold hydrolase n=1 Tax=Saccharopolyspora rhizosphaerae TaxID=2492662 RepID=A0A3R8Q4D0_9PSEU|nr:alpha/beta fold hydrolase [Saccharopolyspora rhizosphaerae]RRO16652.1 alpha/beta fold hydrolase [Saccharopolyspora rhizosphaerae]